MPPIALPTFGRVRPWQVLATLAGVLMAAVFLAQSVFAADVGSSITFTIDGGFQGETGQEATADAPFVLEFQRGTTGSDLFTNAIQVTFPPNFLDGTPIVTFERGAPGALEPVNISDVSVETRTVTLDLNPYTATAGETNRLTFTGNVSLPAMAAMGDFTFEVRAGELDVVFGTFNGDEGQADIPLAIVDPTAPASFEVIVNGGEPVVAGTPFALTIRALNYQGDLVTKPLMATSLDVTYNGGPGDAPNGSGSPTIPGSPAVGFTSGVGTTIAGYYLYDVADSGNVTVTVVATTPGRETTGDGGDSAPITIVPGELASLEVTAGDGSSLGGATHTSGEPFSIDVTGYDAYGNPGATGGDLAISEAGGTLQAAVPFDGSLDDHLVTPQGAADGTYVLTVADADDSPAVTVDSPAFTVQPAEVASFAFALPGANPTAGQPFDVDITAQDAAGNDVTWGDNTFEGTVALSSNATQGHADEAGLGTTAAFTAGVLADHSLTLTVARADAATITANEGQPTESTSAAFTLLPNPTPAALAFVAPDPVEEEYEPLDLATETFTLEVQDVYGNAIGGGVLDGQQVSFEVEQEDGGVWSAFPMFVPQPSVDTATGAATFTLDEVANLPGLRDPGPYRLNAFMTHDEGLLEAFSDSFEILIGEVWGIAAYDPALAGAAGVDLTLALEFGEGIQTDDTIVITAPSGVSFNGVTAVHLNGAGPSNTHDSSSVTIFSGGDIPAETPVTIEIFNIALAPAVGEYDFTVESCHKVEVDGLGCYLTTLGTVRAVVSEAPSGVTVEVHDEEVEDLDLMAGQEGFGPAAAVVLTIVDANGNPAGVNGTYDVTFAGLDAGPDGDPATVDTDNADPVAFAGGTATIAVEFENGESEAINFMSFLAADGQTLSVTAIEDHPGITSEGAGGSGDLTVNVAPAAAHHLEFVGLDEEVEAGMTLLDGVRIEDEWGNLVTGDPRTIALGVTGPSPLVGTTSAPTVNGFADFSGIVGLEKAAPNYRIRATANGATLAGGSNIVESSTFEVVAGAPHHLEVTPSSGTVTAGVPFDLTVGVVDEFGNLLSDFDHELTLDVSLENANESPDTESFPEVQDPDPIVNFTNGDAFVTAGIILYNTGDSGSATVSVSVLWDDDPEPGVDATEIEGESAPLTVLPGTADALTFVDFEQPEVPLGNADEFQAGEALTSIRVGYLDQYGNQATDEPDAIVVELVPNSDETGVLVQPGTDDPATLTIAPTAGVATFDALAVDLVGSYSLRFDGDDYDPITTGQFEVQAGDPASLSLTYPNGDGIQDQTPLMSFGVGKALPDIDVHIVDLYGNPVTQNDYEITAVLEVNGDGPGDAALVLPGDTSAAEVTVWSLGGVATFSDALAVNRVHDNYNLRFSADSAPGTPSVATEAFQVVAGEPAQLVILTDFEESYTPSEFVNVGIEVELRDAFGNHVTDHEAANVTVEDVGNEATNVSAALVSGRATLTGLDFGNNEDTYFIVALSDDLSISPDFDNEVEVEIARDPLGGALTATITPDTAHTDNVDITFAFTTSMNVPAGGSVEVAFPGSITMNPSIATPSVTSDGVTVYVNSFNTGGGALLRLNLATALPPGLVEVTLSSAADLGAKGDVVFDVTTADDGGRHMESGTLSGTVAAGPASYLVIEGPGGWDGTMTAGTAATLTITAYSEDGDVATSFDGAQTLIFSGDAADTTLGASPDSSTPLVDESESAFTTGIEVTFDQGVAPVDLTAVNASDTTATLHVAQEGTAVSSQATGGAGLAVTSVTHGPINQFGVASDGLDDGEFEAATTLPSVTVSVLDEFGNPVTTGGSDVIATLLTGDGAGAFSDGSTSTVAVTAGQAVFDDLAVDAADTGYRIVFTHDTADVTGQTGTFDIVPGAPASLVFSTGPSGTYSPGTLADATFQVDILDAGGNHLTGTASPDADIEVDFEAFVDGDWVAVGEVTDNAVSNGSATASGLSLPRVGGQAQEGTFRLVAFSTDLGITIGDAAAARSTQFDIVVPEIDGLVEFDPSWAGAIDADVELTWETVALPAGAVIVVDAPPGFLASVDSLLFLTLNVDGVISSPPWTPGGPPVFGEGVFTVALTAPIEAGTLTLTLTGVDFPSTGGEYEVEVTAISTDFEPYQDGSGTGTLQASPAATFEVTDTGDWIADEPHSITLNALDGDGGTATGYDGQYLVTLTGLTDAAGGGVPVISGADVMGASTWDGTDLTANVSFVEGSATVSVTLTTAGTPSIGIIGAEQTTGSGTVTLPANLEPTVHPGDIDTWRFEWDDEGTWTDFADEAPAVQAGTPFALRVTGVDVNNNDVTSGPRAPGADGAPEVTLQSTADGSHADDAGMDTPLAFEGGVADVQVAFTLAGTHTISVLRGADTPFASPTFTVAHGAPAALVLDTQPDGDVLGVIDQQPVARVTDAYGNTATGAPANPVPVAITTGPEGASITGASETLAAGVATFDALALADGAGEYVLTFTWTDGADIVLTRDSEAFTLAGGALTSTGVALDTTDAGSEGDVTVTFTTTNGLPAGGSVRVTFPAGFDVSGVGVESSTGLNGTASAAHAGQVVTVTTDQATGNLVDASTAVTLVLTGVRNPDAPGATGTFTIETVQADSAVMDIASGVAGATIQVGPADADTSTVTVSPTSVPANLVTEATITVTFRDRGGNPVAGEDAGLLIGCGGTTGGDSEGTSDALGQVVLSVTADQAGPCSIEVEAWNAGVRLTQTVTVNFTEPVATAANSSITADDGGGATADGVDTATVTVTVHDQADVAIEGATVTLSGGAAPVDATTDASGVATFTVTSTEAKTVTYTATSGGVTLGTAAVTYQAGPPAGLRLTGPGGIEQGSVSSPFTLTVVDAHGNPSEVATATTFTLSSNSTDVAFGSGASVTVPAGADSVTFTYQDMVSGTSTITATWDSGGTDLGSVDAVVTVNPPAVDLPPPPTSTDPDDDDDGDEGEPVEEPDVTRVNEVETSVTSDEAAEVATETEDGATARVVAPANALPEGATISAAAITNVEELKEQAPPPANADVTLAFVIEATDADGNDIEDGFNEPIALQFTVPAGTVPDDASGDDLVLVFWNGSEWVEVAGTVTENEDGSFTIDAEVDHFTIFSVIHQPGRGTFSPAPEAGVTLTIWQGGGYALLDEALADGGSVWVYEDGTGRGYVAGAPDFVNAAFRERYPSGVAAGTPLVVVQ